jgi:hypothetical protein
MACRIVTVSEMPGGSCAGGQTRSTDVTAEQFEIWGCGQSRSSKGEVEVMGDYDVLVQWGRGYSGSGPFVIAPQRGTHFKISTSSMTLWSQGSL